MDYSLPVIVDVISETLELEEWTVYVEYDNITNVNRNQTSEIKIFPNPAKDLTYIKNAKNHKLRLIALDGTELLKKHINSQTYSLNIKDFSKGKYLIEFTCTDTKNRFYDKLLIIH